MWEKLCPGREKTWNSEVYIHTPQAMGFREESALKASSLQMLEML